VGSTAQQGVLMLLPWTSNNDLLLRFLLLQAGMDAA
jgi:hypothetical protein